MCDYSLTAIKSRAAVVGEKLSVTNFGTGTRGFAGIDDPTTAVCVLPGTELVFEEPVHSLGITWFDGISKPKEEYDRVAIFRQLEIGVTYTHHDALEFPDGRNVRLTYLQEGQTATVLQLPAAPRTPEEAQAQRRMEYVE